MNTLPIALEAVDRAEVTILMDNFVDVLLASGADVRKYVQLDISDRNQLIAEHGFSALVTVESDGRRSSVLYDAGLTPQGLTRNLDVLQVPVRDLRAIVISHGHGDHHGGLEGLFERDGRCTLPLVIHPEAWRERKVVLPTGTEIRLPPPNRRDLEAEGVQLVEERNQTLLLENTSRVRASRAGHGLRARISDPLRVRRRLGARPDDLERPERHRQRQGSRVGHRVRLALTPGRSTSSSTQSG